MTKANQIRFLGVIIDENFKCNDYNKPLERNISRSIGLIPEIKWIFVRKSFNLIITSFTLSAIFYDYLIWKIRNTRVRLLSFHKEVVVAVQIIIKLNRAIVTHKTPLFKENSLKKVEDTYNMQVLY